MDDLMRDRVEEWPESKECMSLPRFEWEVV